MPSTSQHLIPQLAALVPELIVFDKGGTLIDFHAMWSEWVIELARCLEVTAGNPVAGRLFRAMGYDFDAGHIAHDGRLAKTSMADLRALTVDVLCEAGLSRQASEAAVAAAWYAPDPVERTRSLTDLAALFRGLRDSGLKIAVATVDDRGPTEAAFAALGVDSFVDALVGGTMGCQSSPHRTWCGPCARPPAWTRHSQSSSGMP